MNKKMMILLLAVIALMGTTSYASTEVGDFEQGPVNMSDPNVTLISQGAGVPECTDPEGRCFKSSVTVQLAANTTAARASSSVNEAQPVLKDGNR